jgi:hypothetical protein
LVYIIENQLITLVFIKYNGFTLISFLSNEVPLLKPPCTATSDFLLLQAELPARRHLSQSIFGRNYAFYHLAAGFGTVVVFFRGVNSYGAIVIQYVNRFLRLPGRDGMHGNTVPCRPNVA